MMLIFSMLFNMKLSTEQKDAQSTEMASTGEDAQDWRMSVEDFQKNGCLLNTD